ncbi:hypothetical protein KA005_57890, partial [bacterium]|nr:hypothetical protein [bacterium]
MKTLPRGFLLQKALVQLRHWALKDLARYGICLISRRINRSHLRFPFIVLVEVTNDCMLGCIMCPRSESKKNIGYRRFDLFKKIVDECSSRRSLGCLTFSGMGEPSLHPQLIEMSKFPKSKGIPRI